MMTLPILVKFKYMLRGPKTFKEGIKMCQNITNSIGLLDTSVKRKAVFQQLRKSNETHMTVWSGLKKDIAQVKSKDSDYATTCAEYPNNTNLFHNLYWYSTENTANNFPWEKFQSIIVNGCNIFCLVMQLTVSKAWQLNDVSCTYKAYFFCEARKYFGATKLKETYRMVNMEDKFANNLNTRDNNLIAKDENSSGLIIRVMKKSDMEKVIYTLTESFLSEPLVSSTINMNFETMENYVRFLSPTFLEDGLTVIAETKDGILTSVLGALDITSNLPQEFHEYCKKTEPFNEFQNMSLHLKSQDLDTIGCNRESLSRGDAAYLWLLGTNPDFRRQGIGRQVIEAAVKYYKMRNYRLALAETTGDYSKNIMLKCGFESKAHVSYASWFPANSMHRKIVENGHHGVHIVVKNLDEPDLEFCPPSF